MSTATFGGRLEPRLAAWAASHAIEEAYRVSCEPSSHGLHVGWQVTVWRCGHGWAADRRELFYFRPNDTDVSTGWRLSRRRAEAVLRALDDAAFWDEGEWPERLGPDGYTASFEGWRTRVARVRSRWSPHAFDGAPAWAMLHAFDAVRPSRLWWWRRVAVGG